MPKTTNFIRLTALALAVNSILWVPTLVSANTPTPTTGSANSKPALPAGYVATKRTVEVRGVSQPNLKPNICNVRPEAFKGCQVF